MTLEQVYVASTVLIGVMTVVAFADRWMKDRRHKGDSHDTE